MQKRLFLASVLLCCAMMCASLKSKAASTMDPTRADSLIELGIRDTQFGRFQEGEQHLSEALRIRRKLLGRLDPDCAVVLQYMADLYLSVGDYARAEQYANDALNIQKEVSGEHSREYAAALTTVGRLCIRQQKLKRAEMLLKRAQEIYQLDLPSEDAAGYADTQLELADVYLSLNKSMQAYDEILEAQRAAQSAYGDRHPLFAAVLAKRAEIAFKGQGDGKTAREYSRQALDIWRASVGEHYLPYIRTVALMGQISASTGDIATAKTEFLQSMKLCRELYASSLDYMSEYQREAFWLSMSDLVERLFTGFGTTYIENDPTLAGLLYDNELFRKGLLLLSTKEVRNAILTCGDEALIARWRELGELKSQLAYERTHASDKSFRQRQLQDRINQLESQLTSSAAAYRKAKAVQQTTWRDISSVLQERHIAIEFFTADNAEGRMYYALLLRARAEQPVLVPLFTEKELEALLLGANGRPLPPTMLYDANFQGKALAKLIYKPLFPYLKPGVTVSFAPAGYLHQLALEYLPYDESRTVGEVYDLRRVSSTRIIKSNPTAAQPIGAAIFGGIDYTPAENIPALPASLTEAEAIHKLLTQAGCRAEIYTARNATKDALKSLSGQNTSLVHIATHGYYLLNDKHAYTLQKGGLYMTAGERMTAWDIALMDMSRTELVALSACKTGLGLISGEGVFGLQRGFKLAGARSLIMSLWKVDDGATRLLMTTFYTKWLIEKKDRHTAFKEAVRAVRDTYEAPEYWAAFIMLD